MQIVVITGMSGSGKTNALRALEDVGYYAIDNLPIRLLDGLVELFSSADRELSKVALVVDSRTAGATDEGHALASVPKALEATRAGGHDVDLVFLEASDAALERRFSETRRRHPLSIDGSVETGIAAERQLLGALAQAATTTIDTTEMSVHDLRRTIQHAFGGSERMAQLSVTVTSFGFKYGTPSDANLVFDVRFLPNPYFVEGLREQSGKDPEVSKFVLTNEDTGAFLERLLPMLDFLLPRYEKEGKAYVTVAIGCTGGRHRSVAIAERVAEYLAEGGRRVHVRHRDVSR
ncbi:MAG: RNase adapter RapZ [Deltaproteobacteria bacterium]